MRQDGTEVEVVVRRWVVGTSEVRPWLTGVQDDKDPGAGCRRIFEDGWKSGVPIGRVRIERSANHYPNRN